MPQGSTWFSDGPESAKHQDMYSCGLVCYRTVTSGKTDQFPGAHEENSTVQRKRLAPSMVCVLLRVEQDF